MPDDVPDDVAAATLEARAAIDSEERLNEELEESDKLIDTFDDKPASSKDHADLDQTPDTNQDDPLRTSFSEPTSNPDDNDVLQEHIEKPDDSQEATCKPSSEEHQPSSEEHQPSSEEHQQASEQQDVILEHADSEKSPTVNEIAAAAEKAAVTAAASAVALTASLPSAVAVPSIPLQGLQTTAYPSFASLTPNAAQLIGHPLVSMPTPTTRRAVRIAPMGVLPLPPHGANPLVSDLPTASAAIMTTVQEPSIDGQVGGGTGTIGEMPKGKRRGISVAVVPNEALTPEERTKQKRMLRNRESAARSRDKRKNKNLQLESSIAKHRAKRETIEKTVEELRSVVQSMQDVLKKHNIPVPI